MSNALIGQQIDFSIKGQTTLATPVFIRLQLPHIQNIDIPRRPIRRTTSGQQAWIRPKRGHEVCARRTGKLPLNVISCKPTNNRRIAA